MGVRVDDSRAHTEIMCVRERERERERERQRERERCTETVFVFVRGKERETETGVDSKSVCVYERVIEGWRIRGIVNTFTTQVGTLCWREGGREGGKEGEREGGREGCI